MAVRIHGAPHTIKSSAILVHPRSEDRAPANEVNYSK